MRDMPLPPPNTVSKALKSRADMPHAIAGDTRFARRFHARFDAKQGMGSFFRCSDAMAAARLDMLHGPQKILISGYAARTAAAL